MEHWPSETDVMEVVKSAYSMRYISTSFEQEVTMVMMMYSTRQNIVAECRPKVYLLTEWSE